MCTALSQHASVDGSEHGVVAAAMVEVFAPRLGGRPLWLLWISFAVRDHLVITADRQVSDGLSPQRQVLPVWP